MPALSFQGVCAAAVKTSRGKHTQPGGVPADIISDALFLIPFGLWMAVHVLGFTEYVASIRAFVSIDAVDWACITMLAVREVLFGRYDTRTILGLLLFIGMGIIAFRVHYQLLIDGVCFVFAARDIPFKELVRFASIELGILLLAVFISAGVGLIANVTYGVDTPHPRYSLGFSHPNVAGCFVLSMMFMWAYLRNDKFGILDVIAMLVIDLGVFYLTGSRTFCLVALALVALMLLNRFVPKRLWQAPAWRIIAPALVLSIVAAGLLLAVCFNPDIEWMSRLDSWFSSRLSLAHSAVSDYGTALFGQQVSFGAGEHYQWSTHTWVTGSAAYIVDCIYVKLFICCGPLFLAAGCALSAWVTGMAVQRGEAMLVGILILWAVYGLMQSGTVYLQDNVFLFLLAAPFAITRSHARPAATPLPEPDDGGEPTPQ